MSEKSGHSSRPPRAVWDPNAEANGVHCAKPGSPAHTRKPSESPVPGRHWPAAAPHTMHTLLGNVVSHPNIQRREQCLNQQAFHLQKRRTRYLPGPGEIESWEAGTFVQFTASVKARGRAFGSPGDFPIPVISFLDPLLGIQTKN